MSKKSFLKKSARWLAPFAVLGIAFAGYTTIVQGAAEPEQEKTVNTLPKVDTKRLLPIDHNVVITSYGEVKPFETTRLSAQVTGEVISWHPDFVDGGIVKRGEILFTIDKANYQAAVLQAEANLANAQALLIEEKARAEVAAKQAKNLPKRQVTDLYLRKPQLLSAQAQVKSAQAALKRARRDLSNCEVKAPYDALVVTRNIGVGQFVNAGAEVAMLNNVEHAEIQIPIAGFDSAFLPDSVEGLAANIEYQGLKLVARQGTVSRDLGVVDSATRMTHLVVRLEDPYGLNNGLPAIKYGSFVGVNFEGKTLSNIYRLPQSLVNNRTVWVVGDDNTLQPREVTVARAEGEFALIADGIEASDQLVLTPPEFPQAGSSVIIADSGDAQTENNDI